MITKKSGFTLSEVLITLTIIGVVAALTLPTLVQNIQQKILISRWKKAYADINQAFELVKSQDEFDKYYNCQEYQCYQNVVNLVIQQYVSKTGNLGGTGIAGKANYKTILGDNFIAFPTFHAAYNVKDITIYPWYYLPHRATIYIDVNGAKNKPNVLGKDLFALEIVNDYIYPIGKNTDGDFCKGFGKKWLDNVQSIYYDDKGNVKDIPSSNYAGLGCSYDYLYK